MDPRVGVVDLQLHFDANLKEEPSRVSLRIVTIKLRHP